MAYWKPKGITYIKQDRRRAKQNEVFEAHAGDSTLKVFADDFATYGPNIANAFNRTSSLLNEFTTLYDNQKDYQISAYARISMTNKIKPLNQSLAELKKVTIGTEAACDVEIWLREVENRINSQTCYKEVMRENYDVTKAVASGVSFP